MHAEITSLLPKYDPGYVAPPADSRKPAAVIRKSHPPDTVHASAPAAKGAAEPAVVLPEIIVHAPAMPKGDVVRLPRVQTAPPGKDLPPQPFESAAAKDARLQKKHLSVFDRTFLNRLTLPLFGVSKSARAAHDEAIENGVTQLNELADQIELAAQTGADAKEQRALKELYYEAMLVRPK